MLEQACAGGPVEIEQGWAQGRATYGGLVGALLLAAMDGTLEGAEGDPQPLRSLTVAFVAPAPPGPTDVEATVLRHGSNVTQCRAELVSGGSVVASALAAFGRSRESAIVVDPGAAVPDRGMPEMGDPEAIEAVPFIDGLTPSFFQHVDLRVVSGALPFSGAPAGELTGWMRLRETPETFGPEHLVALADAWPPAVLQMLTAPAPASTLAWTLEFVADLDGVDPAHPWAYSVRTDTARDGYAHTEARLWRPDGRLTAISRQTVTVFG